MTIAEWLEAVGAGLGKHAHVIEAYGAVTVPHLGTLDDEDIKAIADQLRSAPSSAAPLQIKWITKALASEVKMQANRTADAAKHRTPSPGPAARGRDRFAHGVDEASENECDWRTPSGMRKIRRRRGATTTSR